MGNAARLTALVLLLGFLATSFAYASVFTYYPLNISIAPTPPPVILMQTDDAASCISLTRTSRGAIYYTDFESYPVPGWRNRGGTWSLQPGFKGNAIRGADDGNGIGGASQYYYNTDLSSYNSLWVSLKTRHISGTGWHGIALINRGLNQLYEISINNNNGYIEIWSYNVESTSWTRLASQRIAGYSLGKWYVIVLHYVVTSSSVNFYVWVYDTNGLQVAYTSASSTSNRRFTPAYIGLEVDNVTAMFDDFIISEIDPRSVFFSGLPSYGYAVSIIDDRGDPVNSTVSTSTSVSLGVIPDIVVGTGINGRISVTRANGYACLVYVASDSILGGDSYFLSTLSITSSIGPNSASAVVDVPVSGSSEHISYALALRIMNNDVNPYYARLLLDGSSYLSPGLNLNVTLASSPTTTAYPTVQIVNGLPVSWASGWLTINAGQTAYVYLWGYHSSSPSSSTLDMYLEYCSAPGGMGACVYYPLLINVYSP